MKKNNLLRVENLQNTSETLNISINEIKEPIGNKKKNATLITVFANALKKRSNRDPQIPRPTMFFTFAITILISIILAITVFRDFNALMLMPLIILMFAVLIPITALIFFCELDGVKSYRIVDVFLFFFIGAVICVLCRFVEDKYIYRLGGSYLSYISAFYLSIEQFAQILALAILFKIYRDKDMLAILFMGICLCAGFAFTESLVVGYKNTFIALSTENGELSVVLNDIDSLETSLKNFTEVAFMQIILRGMLIVTFGGVLGGMTSIIYSTENGDKLSARTSLLLLVITVLSNVFWNMSFVNEYFEFFLKIILLFVNMIIFVNLINSALSKRKLN